MEHYIKRDRIPKRKVHKIRFDEEIDFDRKLILDREKKKNEKRKEINNWLKNKSDYLKSI